MNQNAEQHITEIAVTPFFTGAKGKRNLRGAFHQFVFRVIPSKIEILRIISSPGGVRQQISYRYLFPGVGRVGEVFGDFIIERKFALFSKHHYSSSGELLASGTGLKDGFRFY